MPKQNCSILLFAKLNIVPISKYEVASSFILGVYNYTSRGITTNQIISVRVKQQTISLPPGQTPLKGDSACSHGI